jgi:gliding motility associated protien GldN
MKMRAVKLVFLSFLALSVSVELQAQKKKPATRSSRTRTGAGTSGYGAGYGAGYGPGTNSGTDNQTKTPNTNTSTGTSSGGYGAGYGTSAQNNPANAGQPINPDLKVTLVQGSSSGIGDSVAPSLRTDNAIDRNLVKDRTPLAYEHIREDDAVYKQRVWREIDIREKMNLPFRYAANEDNGNQRFISILYNAVQAGEVTVFNGDDDRFTVPLTKEQVSTMVTGGIDTSAQYDLEGNITGYQARQKMMEPDSISRFRLKEEWIFDKESSRMFVRILGIAPIMNQYTSSGVFIGERVLFWAYYPDLRPTLAKYEVYNGKNYAGRMSWEELFESRFFTSYITKSTIDNPYDQSLKTSIKDPLFRLLEGENIKEKIFNYEQDLWSY